MGDFKVVELSWDNKTVCFSIEPEDESLKIKEEEIGDIVEEAIYDAKEEDNFSLDTIADSVYFALSDAGYIVRNIPQKFETYTYNVENYKLEDYER